MLCRLVLTFLALAACTLWPQGLVLCCGVEGHLEIEVGGDACCPSESDECADCHDVEMPDRSSSRAPAPVAPTTRTIVDSVPTAVDPNRSTEPDLALPHSKGSALETVALLI